MFKNVYLDATSRKTLVSFPLIPQGVLAHGPVQHKSSPSDSSVGHRSAGCSWRGLLSPVVCISHGLEDRLWNLLDSTACHFSSLPSWYSSFNKHVFLSLCNLSTVQLFLDFSMKEWGKRCGHANMCSEARNKIFDECLVTRNVSWCGGRP